ncbi:MAG: hypothetical protein KAT53_10230 [Dehalococcoidia bacterium]|nr:hypothetical protein [Dehalococcoidia bacterium]
MEKKPSNNIIQIGKDSIIVKTLDEVLNLLDKDWLVEEEISGNIFVMSKKKAPDTPV